MTQDSSAFVVDRYFNEILSGGKLSAIDEVLAADVVVQPPSYFAEPLRGRQAVRLWFAELRTAFPDLTFSRGGEVVDGDCIASAFRLRGTHRGTYLGLPATDKTIDLRGIDLFRVRDGRIASIEIYYDTLGLMQQLCVAPAVSEERV